jgi:hypothetical protein
MSFINKIIQSLFPQKEVNGSKVLLKEVLKRREKFALAYDEWIQDGSASQMLHEVAHAYYLKKTNISSELNIHLLNTAYANGFAITFNPAYRSLDFEFLFDYLKGEVMGLGYSLANSDRQVKEKDDYIETVDKHYLKPSFQLVPGELCNQKYGNVLLEYVKINDEPSYLKVQVSIYSDRLYTKALSFDDFLTKVFKE